jgi:hypothetical protein
MHDALSGVIAALPLSALGITYVLTRFQTVAGAFREGDQEMASVTDASLRLMLLAMFGLGPLLLGGVAGLVYSAVGTRPLFLGIALGLASLMSIWAVLSRTPMMSEKIVMNFAAALILGTLVPLLAGA